MSLADDLARLVVARRRSAIAAVLLVSVVLGAGAPAVELSTSLEEFRGGTPEAAADEFIEAHMGGGRPNTTQALVVVRDDQNVLTKERYIRHLQAQRALLDNETVNRTLVPEQRPLSIANVVAIIAIRTNQGEAVDNVSVEPRPPLDAQIAALKGLGSYRVELYTSYAVGVVLDDPNHTWPPGGSFAFVPTSYEANQKTADSTAIVVSHRESTDPEALTAAQVAMRDIVANHTTSGDAIVVGNGVVDDELRRSSMDSMLLVGPVAALFVVAVLLLAYRDLLDVVLGLFGVGLVLLWTFGYMGWAGVTFNQLFVAVPVLLMGLSIDYGIHVFMRYREERTGYGDTDGAPVEEAMTVALGGVGPALALVTFTTAAGFLSNLVSGVAPIREFGIVSAVGIVAALVVFGVLVPALKVELDAALEARGWDRRQRAVGTSGGALGSVLAASVATARTAPWAVIAIALLATAGGAYGATQVATDFEQDDLLVDENDVPPWTRDLPEPFAPGQYTVEQDLDYVRKSDFIYDGTLTEILVRGDVARDDSLERLKAATDRANQSEVVLYLPNKNPGTQNAIRVMNQVAEDNETFARVLNRSDADGDGIPDRNVERVYAAFYDAAPEAARTMVLRQNGQYTALRVKVPVDGQYSEGRITSEVRNATAPVGGDGTRAIATGQPVMNQAVAAQLLDTVVESLVATLLVVLGLLAAVYRRAEGKASLGAVTLLPVAFSVTWIVGTMALLGIPFNVMTALITSFTIGLGVDYSIHISERYVYELRQGSDSGRALRRSVLGTGGALLGSAATTAGGFGVLAFAILAPLRQFGVITALTIVYAFLASVFVLPSLLAVWTRHFADEPTPVRATPGD